MSRGQAGCKSKYNFFFKSLGKNKLIKGVHKRAHLTELFLKVVTKIAFGLSVVQGPDYKQQNITWKGVKINRLFVEEESGAIKKT